MAESDEKHGKSKTLFVRNLPYTTTNESLEKVFSDAGPLKSCFVVKDKDTGKCRGFGYVKFTLLEDAEKALTSVKKVDGRNVHAVYANKKEKKKRFGQPNKKTEGESVPVSKSNKPSSPAGEETSDFSDEGQPDHAEKKTKLEVARSENMSLQTKRKKKKKVATETPVKGQRQAPNPLNEGKRARVIVRNLAFKCTKEELQKTFEKCGNVVDIHIPTKGTGTRLGFGFVQFENKAQAGMAVAQLTGTSVAGRPVAVDWALPKNMYESRMPVKPSQTSTSDQDDEEIGEEEEGMDVDEKDEPQEMLGKQKAIVSTKLNGQITKSNINRKVTERDEDKDTDDSDEEKGSESDELETSNEEDEDENSDEDSNDSGIDGDKTFKQKPSLPQRQSDVGEGRTIFIRNLPFAANEEEIEECLSEFGEVKYARIVKDRNSGMSKGSAFVQFVSKVGASTSVEAAANEADGGISLQGRSLIISLAVSREQAGVLTQQKENEKKNKKKEGDKKEEKDSRNLYLSREGMIRPGTEAAKDVPSADLALRTKIAEANRQKLKDQNVFVSSTRLCIHNIPATIDDAKLRKILIKAVKDRDAKITECRIMRDLSRVNTQGQGKSKGFAFCSFAQHAHALAALKNLNNCPTVFGSSKRPIVEFSLENRKALEAKQKRLEKSKMKTNPKHAGKNHQAQTNSDTAQTKKKKWKQRKVKQEAMPLDVKKQQDKIARSMYEGPLGLPSHSGPKQRHKPRQGQQAGKKANLKTPPNQKKTKFGFKGNNPREKKQGKTKTLIANPKKKRRDVDGFDKLVASYKQKIMFSAKF
ncbi:RNA-binding protein 28 [Elysia marginata]|uniref:RNA-binding protein 28 n=1 Tax=Elysia marginata TaxID=1093978 RepID=A0AAV4IFH4_9GAST|nr:RNA-binding protein 28 [Elysia marginata]